MKVDPIRYLNRNDENPQTNIAQQQSIGMQPISSHGFIPNIAALTPADQYELNKRMCTEATICNVRAVMEVEVAKEKSKISLECSKQREDGKRKYLEARERRSYQFVLSKEGIEYIINIPGRHRIVEPFLFVGNIRIDRLVTRPSEEFEPWIRISWDGLDNSIILSESEIDGISLRKAFSQRGVQLLASRRMKTDLLEDLVPFIMRIANDIYIFPYHGWIYDDVGGWQFVDKDTFTAQEVWRWN